MGFNFTALQGFEGVLFQQISGRFDRRLENQCFTKIETMICILPRLFTHIHPPDSKILRTMLEHQKESLPEKFQVWIEDVTTKTPLREYEKEETKDKVSCYITSIYDQLFGIRVNVNDTEECLACDIYIDGQCLRSTIFGKHNDGNVYTTLNIEDFDGGFETAIPLRFGKTEMTGTKLGFVINGRKWYK
jgi:hypothetical protein